MGFPANFYFLLPNFSFVRFQSTTNWREQAAVVVTAKRGLVLRLHVIVRDPIANPYQLILHRLLLQWLCLMQVHPGM